MNTLLSANQYISSSGIVTVYLLMIVFAVLAFLVIVLSVGHKAMQSVQRARQARKAAKAAKKEENKTLPVAETPTIDAPAQEDEETVAAITAAISMILQTEAPQKKAKFVVRKIERI